MAMTRMFFLPLSIIPTRGARTIPDKARVECHREHGDRRERQAKPGLTRSPRCAPCLEGLRHTRPPSRYEEQPPATSRYPTAPGRDPHARGSRRLRCYRATWQRSTLAPRRSLRHCAPANKRVPGRAVQLRQRDPLSTRPTSSVLYRTTAKQPAKAIPAAPDRRRPQFLQSR